MNYDPDYDRNSSGDLPVVVEVYGRLPSPYDERAPESTVVQTTLAPGGFVRIDDWLVMWAVAPESVSPVLPGTEVRLNCPKSAKIGEIVLTTDSSEFRDLFE